MAPITVTTITKGPTTNDFNLMDLLGTKAVSAEGDPISIGSEWAETKQVIALYFSANWCPPCRQFTPKLAKAYQEYKVAAEDKTFELVFVSSDSDEEAFKKYHGGEMTFPALDYNESRGSIKETLSDRYKVQGIPALVVIDAKTGERLDDFNEDDEDDEDNQKKASSGEQPKWPMSPRDMVNEFGAMAFPLSETTAKKCKELSLAKQQKAASELLTLPNVLLPPKQGGMMPQVPSSDDVFTFAKLLDTYEYVSLLLGCNGGLEGVPDIAKMWKKVYDDADSEKKLAVVYIPECIDNQDEDAEPQFDNAHHLFHFQEKPSPKTIEWLVGIAGKTLVYDSLVTLHKTTSQVEECGLDGVCASRSVSHVEIVSLDEYLINCSYHGPNYFPWTPSLVEQATVNEKRRAAEVRSKIESSLESFLMELAADGTIQIGDQKSTELVLHRMHELDDEDGLIALYFTANEHLTEQLVKCMEELNSSTVSGGKNRLEVLFVGPDSWSTEALTKDYAKMVLTDTQTQFMTIDFANLDLRRAMRQAFDLEWGSSIVLMKKDGTLINVDGGAQKAIEETRHFGFPWNEENIATGKEKMTTELNQRNAKYQQTQKDMGLPIICHLVGPTRNARQQPEERIIEVSKFLTFGMPDSLVTRDTLSNYDACTKLGVFYYELELLEVDEWVCAQFGFCAPGGLASANFDAGQGCGDTKGSWGVCGIRHEVWNDNNGKSAKIGSKWQKGDVISLAVNVNAGKIAVAVNGSGASIVVQDETIGSNGVFPCFSIGTSKLRLNATPETFLYSGPSPEVWMKKLLVV